MRGFAVEIGPLKLAADIVVPEQAQGVVIFAHGSGSSRFSSRNRDVASQLSLSGFATILFDLLTENEAQDRRNVFDIELLAGRMSQVVAFSRNHRGLRELPAGLFGASTGAAAALMVAAKHERDIGAVVSRGGRPDLALAVLDRVRAPTLLIVGELDEAVIEMNRTALAALRCMKRLDIVAGATHLFEEPGTLDRVVVLATLWFSQHLRAPF